MKFGIFFSYWEHDWKGDYFKYVQKAHDLGLDVLEISAGALLDMSDGEIVRLRELAKSLDVEISCNLGPQKQYDLASSDSAVRERGMVYEKRILDKMRILGSTRLIGVMYSFWPYDFSDLDKDAIWKRSVTSMKELGTYAQRLGITLCLEVLNRFENLLLNTAEEGVAFVEEVDCPAVKLLLDTFHMNIEENCITDAILLAGKHIGHFHVGERNRRLPCDQNGSLDWKAIGKALNDVGYDGYVIAEPFVTKGGKIGSDIGVWRNLYDDTSETALDRAAEEYGKFIRQAFAK